MRRIIIMLKNILSVPARLLFTKISIFAILQETNVDNRAAIAMGVKLYRSTLGKYSYINRNCFITDTSIGKFCSIGENCIIGGAAHPIDWVSSSPVFHGWKNIMKKNFSKHKFEIFSNTNIGNDVWIGTNVIIKAGITISDGAIIGMGSVLTKDVGPYEIWVGNPARCIKKRFDDATIDKLSRLEWWNLSDKEIEDLASDIKDVDKFILRVEEMK